MATQVKFVSPEHAEILAQYIPEGSNNGVTLVFSQPAQATLKELDIHDGDVVDFDYDGSADCLVDRVDSVNHYFMLEVTAEEE